MQKRSNAWRRLARATGRVALAVSAGLLASTASLAETITLEGGDEIEVEIIEQTDEKTVVEHPVLGRIEIPAGGIKVEEPEPIKPGLFGTPFLRGWDRQVGFGFNGAQGNSQSASVNAALDLNGKGENYEGTFGAGYFFGKQLNTETGETDKNTNSAFTTYRHNLLIFGEAPFFLWGNVRYDYDEFQDFENRVTGQAGFGWEIVKNDHVDLNFDLGAGFNRAWGDVDDTIPEGVAGLRFEWRITEGQKFTADATYFPDLANWSSFRLLSNAAYEISLGFIEGLGLKFGVQDEYRSEIVFITDPPFFPNEKNNLRYFGNLTYSF